MKCGTSTLHDQLALRSCLFLSHPKEPNFFSDDAAVAERISEYTSLFSGARHDQLCGESSTHYTKRPTYPNSASNLARFCPNARLIYVVRDPLERIVSQYIHEWSQREVSLPFNKAVRELERYTAYSSYAHQLEPYLERFGSDRVLLVFFERLLAAPSDELRRVCAFLGDPSPEPVLWCEERGQRNVSKDRLRKSAARDSLLRVPFIKALKDRLPFRLRESVKNLWRLQSRPKYETETLAWARSEIDRDLARLGTWIGSELSSATFKERALSLTADWVNPPTRQP
jgi:hypothetical protein